MYFCIQQRQVLEQDAVNKETLETIDTALFVVSLESNNPADHQDYCRRSFHSNGRNVWFDKSFTMLIYPDGRYSNNVEHSCLDATVSATCNKPFRCMHVRHCLPYVRTCMYVHTYVHVCTLYICMYVRTYVQCII